jgi:hypothetical protein
MGAHEQQSPGRKKYITACQKLRPDQQLVEIKESLLPPSYHQFAETVTLQRLNRR